VVPHRKNAPKWKAKPPVHINMNYDQTCNLKCPSCRHDFIHLQGDKLKKVQSIQEYVEHQILPTVESIALTGVGDPFMSRVLREFLINFDTKRYPNIRSIHLHTNGQLFDEKMYQKMKGIHGLKLSTDISIDAATAETYSKVRPPGDWNRLMQNLQFIKNLDNLVLFGISMVVQRDNYKEMLPFIALGKSLVHGNRATFVEFKRPRQYNHLSDAEYEAINPDCLDGPDRQEFLTILAEVERKRTINARRGTLPAINHNLQEYLPNHRDESSLLDKMRTKLKALVPASYR